MFDINNIVRENIKHLKPYSSARDEFSGETGVFLDANENPFGLHNRYPDPHQKALKQEISALKNIKTSNLFLGNGSDEIIDLLFRVFCVQGKDKVLSFTPTYGMYKVVADINDIEFIEIPLNNLFQINIKRTIETIQNENVKIIFICSPNNPTGTLFNKHDIEFLIKNFDGIIVIDEAYIDFSSEESWSLYIDDYPNLVVLQTLSKAWGMAGLRLGIAITNDLIIRYLNKVKLPYNISSINQTAALDIIRQKNIFAQNINILKKEKQKTKEELSKLPVIKQIFPSEANFLLIEVDNANKLYEYLINKKIIVRNRHSVIKNCLRISIGTPEENKLLINELRKYSLLKIEN